MSHTLSLGHFPLLLRLCLFDKEEHSACKTCPVISKDFGTGAQPELTPNRSLLNKNIKLKTVFPFRDMVAFIREVYLFCMNVRNCGHTVHVNVTLNTRLNSSFEMLVSNTILMELQCILQHMIMILKLLLLQQPFTAVWILSGTTRVSRLPKR